MDIDARAFGQLEGEVKSLATMMEQQNKTLEAQNAVLAKLTAQVGELSTTLSEARGGWRTLLWIGGGCASAAGLVTWVVQHLTFRAGP